jgi:hypothetical protein
LDLDTDRSYRQFQERVRKIEHLVRKPIVVVATRPHHWHVFIRLKKRHRFVDICALQVYLGSDVRRELANMSRIIAGATLPILLIDYGVVKHWGHHPPNIVCSCPPKDRKGRKLGNCRHLMAARGHKAKYGFLSTRLKIIGVKDPYGHS